MMGALRDFEQSFAWMSFGMHVSVLMRMHEGTDV